MENDASLFSSLNTTTKNKIYVVDDFSLDITGHGDIPFRHSHIMDLYDVPSLSANMFSISQLT